MVFKCAHMYDEIEEFNLGLKLPFLVSPDQPEVQILTYVHHAVIDCWARPPASWANVGCNQERSETPQGDCSSQQKMEAMVHKRIELLAPNRQVCRQFGGSASRSVVTKCTCISWRGNKR